MFAIAKFETLKFRICSNETNILQSTFESTESKTKRKQGTSQLNKSKVFMIFCNKVECLLVLVTNTLAYCEKFLNYGRNKFYNTGLWVIFTSFSSILMNGPNKRDFLPKTIISDTVLCNNLAYLSPFISYEENDML
jgi:hypothetical protein